METAGLVAIAALALAILVAEFGYRSRNPVSLAGDLRDIQMDFHSLFGQVYDLERRLKDIEDWLHYLDGQVVA